MEQTIVLRPSQVHGALQKMLIICGVSEGLSYLEDRCREGPSPAYAGHI